MKTNRFLSLAIIFAVLMSASSAYAVSPVVIAAGKWVMSKYAENKEVREKMQEIQPTYDAWLDSLEVYVKKTGKVGDCNAIGLKKYFTDNRLETPNFSYECGVKDGGNIAFLNVTNKIKIGKCDAKSVFKAEFDIVKNYLDVFSIPIGNDACVFFQPGCRTLISGSCPPNMVYVEGGLSRKVTVNNFCISKYEVTQKEWQDVMGSNPSEYKSCGNNCPVEQVSWDNAQEFISKLNVKTGMKYRLPSEAEWEYAAKGGCRSNNYSFSGSNTAGDVAWCRGNCKGTTHAVGTKKPNELGIYDMTGNVGELVKDSYKIIRGGKIYDCIGVSVSEVSYSPRHELVGFRLIHSPIDKATSQKKEGSGFNDGYIEGSSGGRGMLGDLMKGERRR